VSEEERFWIKVEWTPTCWLWTAAKRGRGYGCFSYKGRVVDAHRVAYMLTVGEIPGDSVVMHSCDNPLCVNPDHLSAGSWQANTRDAMQKERHNMPPGSGKLTIEDIREILQLYKDSGQFAWIARRYHLDKKTVGQIIRGEIWRDNPTNTDAHF
jgi:hypothetical protein